MSSWSLIAIASLRGFVASHALPLTLIVGIPAVIGLVALSYVMNGQAEEGDEEDVNTDDGNSSSSTMMSTRDWLAQRYVPCALEAAIVESIPLVKFTPVAGNEAEAAVAVAVAVGSSSCVVCLTAFEEEEEVKVLPSCQHAFHPLCIDPWFETHSTCPICRSEVAPSSAKAEPGSGEEVFAACHELTHVPLIEIVVD